MSVIRPNWSDNQVIIADQVLARGSVIGGTLDLLTTPRVGAMIFAAIGRGGTAALTNGVNLEVRRLFNGTVNHPSDIASRLSSTAAATGTTVNVNSNSGQAALNVTSVSSFAAGDLICIQDSGGGVTRLEWNRVSKTAAGVLTLDYNLQYSHTSAQADTVRNKADVFAPFWLPGGSQYAFIFDYGDDSAGDSVTVRLGAQVYNHDVTSVS